MNCRLMRECAWRVLGSVLGLSLVLACGPAWAAVEPAGEAAKAPPAASEVKASAPEVKAPETKEAEGQTGEPQDPHRYVHQGLVIELDAHPVGGKPGDELMAGQLADIRFKMTSESGEPVSGYPPGAWLDLAQVIQGKPGARQKSCKDKIALYLQGTIGIRPMVDMNSYYVLVLNKESSISVIDPVVSMMGMTSTYARVFLEHPGMDWAYAEAAKRLFVSLPAGDEVAVVQTDNFKLQGYVKAGVRPTRVALQPDGKYLWVGNDAEDEAKSGVTVIDTDTLKPVAHIETGRGHHEIAFSDDSRKAFISNRLGGTVTVVDVQKLAKVANVETGPLPISLGWSTQAKALYVADGKAGTIAVVDPQRQEVVRRIEAKPGLGPLRFTRDGRWGLVVNPAANEVVVFDPATNEVVHTVEVKGKPYQLVFSDSFAYVRSLESERVHMIALASLGPGKAPVVQYFPAGAAVPAAAGDLVLADSVTVANTENSVMVVNPGDNTTYYYMEGMNAPSTNYQSRGASARAVMVVDRSLKEVEPGVYEAKIKIPTAGIFDVAFLYDTPRILHCFSLEAKANPRLKPDLPPLGVEYLTKERNFPAGEEIPLRFKLGDPATGAPRSGLSGVRVMYFRAPGRERTEVPVEDLGEGIYQAKLHLRYPGAYYVYVGVGEEHLAYGQLPFFTLLAKAPDKARAAATSESKP